MKLNPQDNCVRKSFETEGLMLPQYNVEYTYICFIYPRIEVYRIAVELISEQTLVVRYDFCELRYERKNVGAACFSSEIPVRRIKLVYKPPFMSCVYPVRLHAINRSIFQHPSVSSISVDAPNHLLVLQNEHVAKCSLF